MRSMLISLILFCSLTQLAIADGPPPVVLVPNHKSLKGCGGDSSRTEKIYQCYVPEICTDATKAGGKITAGAVAKVNDDTPVSADCPALIKFFQYTKGWAYISIESFKEISEIDSITFSSKYEIHDDTLNKDILVNRIEFSCKYENTAKSAQDPPNMKQRGRHLNSLKYEEEDPEPGEEREKTLKCVFEVIKQGSTTDNANWIFKEDRTDKAVFKTCLLAACTETNPDSLEAQHGLLNFDKCDPRKIVFNRIDNIEGLLLEKVQYNPEGFFCKEKKGIQYKMQYRKAGEKEYVPAEMVCKANKFNINTKNDPSNEIDVRCAAEVKSLCNYDVLTTGQNGPFRTTGNDDEASKLECKGQNKYLNIVYSQTFTKTILHPKFECSYFGGSAPFWVVSDSTLGFTKVLTVNGPEVYCTDKVDCYKQWKLSGSSVENGKLDDKFLPKCLFRGTLFVKDGNLEKEANNTRCNDLTGNFMYTDADGDHIMNDQTKFVCNYPRENSDAKTSKLRAKIAMTTIGLAVGLVIFIGLIIAASCAYAMHRQKKEKKRIETQHEAAWFKYCATKDEKAAYKKKKEKENKNKKESSQVSSEGEPVQYWSWNNMIMHWQHNVVCSLGVDPTTGRLADEEPKTTWIGKIPSIRKKEIHEQYDPDPYEQLEDSPPVDKFVDYGLRGTYKWFKTGNDQENTARNEQKGDANKKKKPKSE